MPVSSTREIASLSTCERSISFSCSSATSTGRASLTVMRLRVLRPMSPPKRSFMLIPIDSMPCGVNISTVGMRLSATSSSTSLSSRAPSRSERLSARRRSASEASRAEAEPIMIRSSSRSSAARSARTATSAVRSARTSWIAASTRSRMIDSTSRPT